MATDFPTTKEGIIEDLHERCPEIIGLVVLFGTPDGKGGIRIHGRTADISFAQVIYLLEWFKLEIMNGRVNSVPTSKDKEVLL